MTTEELLEEIALISDTAENYVFAASIPLSAATHKERLIDAMKRIKDRLRKVCIANGKNPWVE